MTILVNSVNKQMLKRIRNDKQNAVTLNLFQGLVVRYFATLSMTIDISRHSEPTKWVKNLYYSNLLYIYSIRYFWQKCSLGFNPIKDTSAKASV